MAVDKTKIGSTAHYFAWGIATTVIGAGLVTLGVVLNATAYVSAWTDESGRGNPAIVIGVIALVASTVLWVVAVYDLIRKFDQMAYHLSSIDGKMKPPAAG